MAFRWLAFLFGADDVAQRKATGRITVHTHVAEQPMSAEQWASVRRRLARCVALAFVADHPELFHPGCAESEEQAGSGPSAAAAAVAGALPASAGGPARESREHDEPTTGTG